MERRKSYLNIKFIYHYNNKTFLEESVFVIGKYVVEMWRMRGEDYVGSTCRIEGNGLWDFFRAFVIIVGDRTKRSPLGQTIQMKPLSSPSSIENSTKLTIKTNQCPHHPKKRFFPLWMSHFCEVSYSHSPISLENPTKHIHTHTEISTLLFNITLHTFHFSNISIQSPRNFQFMRYCAGKMYYIIKNFW